MTKDRERPPLRRGWTTGSCATAAAKSAWSWLQTGQFPDPVTISLPNRRQVSFALDGYGQVGESAWARIIKDAGDDPDVTHGALITATVRRGAAGQGVTFMAGEGVGVITRPGLPLPPGAPAINPVPRRMIMNALIEVTPQSADAIVTISIENGEALARQTLNPRLGIMGGLSILGTTGIVVPFSCSAWIDTIHRGIDVARASGLTHIAGSTGSTSEACVKAFYDLPDPALIEMGDFVGGMLKYLRQHPVPHLTIAGGIAKMTKLAHGHLDLHSSRTLADPGSLAIMAEKLGVTSEITERMRHANTVLEAFQRANHPALGDLIAAEAAAVTRACLAPSDIAVDVIVTDREGRIAGRSAPHPA